MKMSNSTERVQRKNEYGKEQAEQNACARVSDKVKAVKEYEKVSMHQCDFKHRWSYM